MATEELFKFNGTIKKCLPNATFRVTLENGHEIMGTISGRIRKHNINILLGDSVEVEVSPYDLTKGRITFRYK